MAFDMDEVVVAFSHACLSAFLLQSIRKDAMSGLSGQTLLAMTVCSVLALSKKFIYPLIDSITGATYDEGLPEWKYEVTGWFIDTGLLLASIYALHQRRMDMKSASNERDGEDTFGRSHVRYFWFNILRQKRPLPAYLHWLVVYVSVMVLAVPAAWAQAGFSWFGLAEWARDRPGAMIAIYVDFLRGIGLLPQLHMARKAGQFAPSLALWIAMKGVTDLVEILADGIVFEQFCYLVADVISFLAVCDFLWLFLKARLRGQSVVEVPMNYEI